MLRYIIISYMKYLPLFSVKPLDVNYKIRVSTRFTRRVLGITRKNDAQITGYHPSKYVLYVRNIPKFKDRANWSRDTFQPMRGRACVYQQTNQNIAIKNFENNGRRRTESVIVSRLSGIF